MRANAKKRTIAVCFLLAALPAALGEAADQKPTFEEYLRANVPSREAIDVFLHGMSWAKFDPVVGYRLGNFIGHYNPAGNHFFAYAIKKTVVDWLDPKPLPYRETEQRMIEF